MTPHSIRSFPVLAYQLTSFAAAAFLLTAVSVHAQNSAKKKSADDDWTDILNLAKPVSINPVANGKPKTREELTLQIGLQVDQSKQAAQAARDFYLQHPDHPKAAEARKVEAVAALHGVRDGDINEEQAAAALARS